MGHAKWRSIWNEKQRFYPFNIIWYLLQCQRCSYNQSSLFKQNIGLPVSGSGSRLGSGEGTGRGRGRVLTMAQEVSTHHLTQVSQPQPILVPPQLRHLLLHTQPGWQASVKLSNTLHLVLNIINVYVCVALLAQSWQQTVLSMCPFCLHKEDRSEQKDMRTFMVTHQ